jgi:hypothetical protein
METPYRRWSIGTIGDKDEPAGFARRPAHVSKSIEPLVGCGADTDSGLHVRKNIEGLFRAAGTVNSSLAGMGTLWEIDTETPTMFQRADFPAIYEDPVAAAEVLPGAFSVERDASGSHRDMILTIGP